MLVGDGEKSKRREEEVGNIWPDGKWRTPSPVDAGSRWTASEPNRTMLSGEDSKKKEMGLQTTMDHGEMDGDLCTAIDTSHSPMPRNASFLRRRFLSKTRRDQYGRMVGYAACMDICTGCDSGTGPAGGNAGTGRWNI